jgi:ABC-type dipeptide/oligopeptide/nickel transport system permease subunit
MARLIHLPDRTSARSEGPRFSSGTVGAVVLALIVLPCFLTLPWSLRSYDDQRLAEDMHLKAPSYSQPMGTDDLARSMLWRCLLGGAISLGIGIASAAISVSIGVTWGALAGYIGGRADAILMRIVDVLYGLPYILLVVLLDLAIKPWTESLIEQLNPNVAPGAADVVTLLLAIGGISWLTMARVIRGQVLSLRAQPFIEAARACGSRPVRIFFLHLLPNLIGPIVVYATLTVPVAILQESFLSFLGIGVQLPLPSWGNLAAEGTAQIHAIGQRWWLLMWPCLLLGLTLMALNFLGEALRNRFDPRRRPGCE